MKTETGSFRRRLLARASTSVSPCEKPAAGRFPAVL